MKHLLGMDLLVAVAFALAYTALVFTTLPSPKRNRQSDSRGRDLQKRGSSKHRTMLTSRTWEMPLSCRGHSQADDDDDNNNNDDHDDDDDDDHDDDDKSLIIMAPNEAVALGDGIGGISSIGLPKK
ncbi:uncharacterized protein LOC142817956 isoform X1 [Rhipicephalus microplus]|uniref:uncharacterized protein LOC142817956 isoform X1 n=1 Tax=Rhipicephalus microplus TaxID=6941 RepID=UPI003F6D5591